MIGVAVHVYGEHKGAPVDDEELESVIAMHSLKNTPTEAKGAQTAADAPDGTGMPEPSGFHSPPFLKETRRRETIPKERQPRRRLYVENNPKK